MMIKSDINLQIIFPGIVNPSYLKDPIHLWYTRDFPLHEDFYYK